MSNRLNGVKMELTFVEETSVKNKRQRGEKVTKFDRAARAVMSAYQDSDHFMGLNAQQVMFLMNAALQDEYIPLRKLVVKHGGTRLQRAITEARIERFATLDIPYRTQ